jgi:hypothetical protein
MQFLKGYSAELNRASRLARLPSVRISGGAVMDETKKAELNWSRIGVPIAQIGLISLFVSLGFGIATLIFWIQFKALPHWSAVDFGLSMPVTHWSRLDRIVSYVYRAHLGIVCLLAGWALLFLGMKIADT